MAESSRLRPCSKGLSQAQVSMLPEFITESFSSMAVDLHMARADVENCPE